MTEENRAEDAGRTSAVDSADATVESETPPGATTSDDVPAGNPWAESEAVDRDGV